MAVILVQHGAKEPGVGDPGLTPAGRRQAESTGRWLASRFNVTRVAASPLRRSRETAVLIAATTALEVEIDERLTERMNWDGVNPPTAQEFLAEWERSTHERAYTPPSGDSSLEAARRLHGFLQECIDQTGDLVVATHGGVTVDLLRSLLGDPVLIETHPMLLREGIPSCALTILEQADGDWVPRVIASTAHLPLQAHRRP